VLHNAKLVLLTVGVALLLAMSVPVVSSRLADLQPEQRVAGVEGNSLMWRVSYWRTVAGLADRSPLVGIGPKMTQYVTDSAKVPHNDYLRAYVETGIVGLTVYVAVVLALLHTARNSLRWAPPGLGQGIAVGFAGCVASFVVFSVGENLMSQVVVLWYFAAFAAAAIAAARGQIAHLPAASDGNRARSTPSLRLDPAAQRGW
jgi:O-antigen ligase